MTKKANKQFLIICHNVLAHTSIEEAKAVLSRDYAQTYHLEFKSIMVSSKQGKTIQHQQLQHINWQVEALHQKQIFERYIKTHLDQFPDFEVVYFGMAPIPLAIHLGYLLGSWQRPLIYLRHHMTKEWYQTLKTATPSTSIVHTKGIPKESYQLTEDILIRVQSSYQIDATEVQAAITNNIAKDINIQLDPLLLDTPQSEHDLSPIVHKFSESMTAIANHLKSAGTIHLVASVPVGLAFLLGTCISANVHHEIQTYQYVRHANPKYLAAITLGRSTEVQYELTKEEITQMDALKADFQSNWHKIQRFFKWLKQTQREGKSWYVSLLSTDDKKESKKSQKPFGYYFWDNLPNSWETPLYDSKFSVIQNVIDGFEYLNDQEAWAIDHQMLYRMSKRFGQDSNQLLRAIRLLFFHEGMHYWSHKLTNRTMKDIGRFPKILEAADYQSDVWAMLHEYYYATMYDDSMMKADDVIHKKNPSTFFATLIETALQTMWAFDDTGFPLKEIQVRQLNRYLIWYWQLARIQDKRCDSLVKILQILAELPIIEFKGLSIRTDNDRVFFQLSQYQHRMLELGVLWNNKIERRGRTGNANLDHLVTAITTCDHTELKTILSGIFQSI